MEWTGVRLADLPTVEVATWIAAPPERIWPLVSDIALMPTMSGELQDVAWCEGAVGERFVGRNRHDAMGEWTTTSYVVENEPPKVFGWAVEDPNNPSASWRFTLEPDDSGTTVRQWMRMGPGPSGVSMAIERMPDKEQKIVFVRMRELEQSMTATLAAIKERVEATR